MKTYIITFLLILFASLTGISQRTERSRVLKERNRLKITLPSLRNLIQTPIRKDHLHLHISKRTKEETTDNSHITTGFSLTKFWLDNPYGKVLTVESTVTPKIGYDFGYLSLNAGPSFLLGSDDLAPRATTGIVRLKDTQLNIQLHYRLDW